MRNMVSYILIKFLKKIRARRMNIGLMKDSYAAILPKDLIS